MKLDKTGKLLLVLSVGICVSNLCACEPDLGYRLLGGGNAELLTAPEADFGAELARMNLIKTQVRAAPPAAGFLSADHALHSMEVELQNLRTALKEAKTTVADSESILARHREQRQRLATFIAERALDPVRELPGFPVLVATHDLPPEFADYFEGLITWHDPRITDKSAARACWEGLLARPEAERRFKTVWATYMLGRSAEDSAPDEALQWYQKVRALARSGWADSLGLAAASLGREARVHLERKNYGQAIVLYLEQMASGDPSALNSLRFVIQQAVHDSPERLVELAREPVSQKVITSWLISFESSRISYYRWQAQERCDPALGWLEAVERAGVKDVDSAEKLALASYQANRMDIAERWCLRAPHAPVSCWIQAKLLLRKGRLDKAAALLAQIAPLFPVDETDANDSVPRALQQVLSRSGGSTSDRVNASRQMHAELAVLRLSRSQYLESLDTLLRAGFWSDAAYVAERVLTLKELKRYVDESWSATSAPAPSREFVDSYSPVDEAAAQNRIRYLLGRRLLRTSQGHLARPYFPEDCLESFDRLTACISKGRDEGVSAIERAKCLASAAFIMRTNGLELVGTEVEPDWRMYNGEFELESAAARDDGSEKMLIPAGLEEIRRTRQHKPDPDVRFHYRYTAVSLAWEAAQLAPDNTDTCAIALWAGGSFIKNRDLELADVFYKALVRRNRNTALGQAADKIRWFPSTTQVKKILSGSSAGD